MSSPHSIDEAAQAADAASAPGATSEAPVVIEARGVEKTFRIPTHRIDSFKERAVHPLARTEYRQLRALRGISFDVHRGEFFGIVGRNGSGKSTLLKILASIYRADAGTIRMAGRPAPFIELGVGFNPDLTARENVILNGVMMGLTRREATARLDPVLEFAELEEFVDLKLKNYSSGMMVRLAFSVMIQADTEILLIDEVLAVGDAAFQQKCTDVFREMRNRGRTVVLVTHSMSAVQEFCHRAMLIDEGRISYIGDPEEVGRRYLRANFGQGTAAGDTGTTGVPDMHARLVHASLEGPNGEPATNLEVGQPISFEAVIEARTELRSPIFSFQCANADGVDVFTFHSTLDLAEGQPDLLDAGQRVRLAGTIENPLTPGRYFINCWVVRSREPGDLALQAIQLLDFVIYGPEDAKGVLSVRADVEATPEDGAGR